MGSPLPDVAARQPASQPTYWPNRHLNLGIICGAPMIGAPIIGGPANPGGICPGRAEINEIGYVVKCFMLIDL